MGWHDELHHCHFRPGGDLLPRVLVAGWGRLGPWWGGATARHPFWILYANDRDGAELALPDGAVLPLDRGRVWLIPPMAAHAGRCRSPVGHHWIHADLVGLAPRAVQELCPAPVPLERDAGLDALLGDLRSAALALPGHDGDDPGLRCHAQALLLAAFGRWWRRLDGPARDRLSLARTAGPLEPALRRIEQDLAAPLYNEALARACGLSPASFTRRFRETLGQSPAQYVLDRRIARAAELLLTGGLPIEAVAAELGFPDRYYFTRVFTRRMGVSPAAYRERAG